MEKHKLYGCNISNKRIEFGDYHIISGIEYCT